MESEWTCGRLREVADADTMLTGAGTDIHERQQAMLLFQRHGSLSYNQATSLGSS